MRVYSQFPQPDFHRLDTRPYGLRTKSTNDKKIRKSAKHVSRKERGECQVSTARDP